MDEHPDKGLPDLDVQDEQPTGKLEVETETIDLNHVRDDSLDQSGGLIIGHLKRRELAKLFDALPTPLFLIDQGYTIRFLNSSCSKIDANYKYMLGRPFVELFRKERLANAARSAMISTLAVHKPHTVTSSISIGKGIMYARISFRSLRMEKRRFLLALVEDLTPEKMKIRMYQRYQKKLEDKIIAGQRAEEAIRKSELMFRSLFMNAPVGIMIVSPKGMVRFFNVACTGIIGYSLEELKSKPLSACVHPEDRSDVSQKQREQLQSPGTPTAYACRIIDSAGRTKHVQIVSVTVQREGRQSVMMFLEDVTRKRRLEEETAKFERLESLGMLAGGIAHDFNNILTAIQGNISLGKASLEFVQKASNNLASAERACMRATELAHQLLTFSKGGTPIKRATALPNLLSEGSSLALQGSSIRAEFSIQPDLWTVSVDPGQISQVINNLLINADHAMPQGGVVQVTAENVKVQAGGPLPLSQGDYVKVMFHDNGPGIAPEALSRIFDPYYTTKVDGKGLGLATAYSIVKNHGGVITVESSSANGTTFAVYLPATQERALPPKLVSEILVHGNGRLLIMDDELQIRELAAEALFHLGYKVEAASEGGEALELYSRALDEKKPFDAVLLDLTVPGGMGGQETARRILKMDPEAKLIVSSGYSTDPVMEDHESYGFRAMVRKPYTLGELSQTLHDVIEQA